MYFWQHEEHHNLSVPQSLRPRNRAVAATAVPLSLRSGESNQPLTPTLLKSIAIHLSRYFCKSMPSAWQELDIQHQFVSLYGSHLYRDAFAEVLGSGIVGTPPNQLVGSSVFTKPYLYGIRLPLVSPSRCRSIGARGHWNTPKP